MQRKDWVLWGQWKAVSCLRDELPREELTVTGSRTALASTLTARHLTGM